MSKNAVIYQMVTDRIIAQLEKGTVPWRKSWSGGGSMLSAQANYFSRKPYRGANAFMTAAMGYESPYWMTYKQASSIGAQVKRGEKSTPIIFWKKMEYQTGEKKPDGSDKTREFMLMRYFSVFNADQIEGLPSDAYAKPEATKGPDFKPIEAAQAIVQGFSGMPRLEHAKQQAFYSPTLDYINMPKPETFDRPEEYYSTLFHEMTHSTGHPGRLNRGSIAEPSYFGSHEYSREELVAEMGAAFLTEKAGISAPVFDNQAAYIAGWLKQLKNDPKLVVWAAGQAQRAADLILGAKANEETTEASDAA